MSRNVIQRIKRLYYDATSRTIERDLREAVQLIKSLPDEPTRAKAAVYMDGLSQMRSEWRTEKQRKRPKSAGHTKRSMPTVSHTTKAIKKTSPHRGQRVKH